MAGRPNVYDTHIKPNLNIIAKLRSGDDPSTHEEIIKFLKVSKSVYYKHMAQIEEFMDTIKKSNEAILEKTEASLYALAQGTAKKRRIEEIYSIVDGVETLTSKKVVTEELPPDNTSVFFTLVNLSNGKWNHKQEIAVENVKSNLTDRIKEAKETLGL